MIDDERHHWLQEQHAEIAAMAGGLAHEIRNPLSTISLNLQLLAEDLKEAQTQQERRALQKIETVQKECRRLEEILNDFLRYARTSDLDLTPANLNEVLQEMIDFAEPSITSAGIVLRSNLTPALPRVALDVDQFKQALLNLLLNAQQAMPKGGELILKTWQQEGRVLLEVIDTGIGMAKKTQEQIFKPFYSTKTGGTGLGLPTTKRIIEAHRGRLTVASELGKGTAFTVELPVLDAGG